MDELCENCGWHFSIDEFEEDDLEYQEGVDLCPGCVQRINSRSNESVKGEKTG
jgi:hypothetical protein